jgi:hypothetical protein
MMGRDVEATSASVYTSTGMSLIRIITEDVLPIDLVEEEGIVIWKAETETETDRSVVVERQSFMLY